jgi:hypothetical protein
MLRLKSRRFYRVAKYPRKRFTPYRKSDTAALVQKGGLALMLSALLDACDGTGVTGPPPVEPDLVTENEARSVIEAVFTDNGITMINDVPVVLKWSPQDSTTLVLDGFNDSLRVGYEYHSSYNRFLPEENQAIEDAIEGDGPWIRVIDTQSKDPGASTRIRLDIEAFIDTLKANGII